LEYPVNLILEEP